MEITSYLGSIGKRFSSFLTVLYPLLQLRPSAVEIVITITEEHGRAILRILYDIPYTL